ncbi:TonB-dependent receptor plug domain-containing protein [Gelidibacter sp.]|uniref:TonB-dependent receptor plug domain-containing protein n=1 Tax=Gelidibacter sp. TaxID=2018083 RepID=UPI002C52EA0D|nr:TonB-dependent receptor [Gelidibacter sp.]HUH28379.1 TonB-dependent receptor [Gelidibacter sp.]
MKNLFYILLFLPTLVFSQEKIEGIIVEITENKHTIPLPGANVYWLDSSIGTTTDIDGKFSMPYQKHYTKLVISYVGYKTDTLTIVSPKYIKHALKSTSELDEITVTSRKQATSKSYMQSANVSFVSSDELLKAACCNLSESFETNPSIDVNFADAVTGTRQIKMLGLTSPYILITAENIPTIRGASQAYGLSFTPGTWVESIQITKGAGSVVNGFESIAGQINTELVKPTTDNKLFVNLYGANSERMEANVHLNTKVSEKWSTGLYLHGNMHDKKHDVNDDGFMDMPIYKQINFMNRWQYTNPEKGFVSFINFSYLDDSKQTGQLNFIPETDKLTTNAWGSEIDTRRFDVSLKSGYVNPNIPWQSVGFQSAFSSHKQNSYFGLNPYDILHNSLYLNGIYNSIISDSRHKIKTGVSYTYDHYDELVLTENFERTESSVGAFFEYNFDNLEDLNLTAGLRIDRHNVLGTFVTPRVHARYTPWEKSALRASFGRGKRSASIFAENQNIFATSRTILIDGSAPLGSLKGAYGLDPEIAWNYGVSFLQGFNLFGNKADIIFDYYRTDFQNQIVVDYENPQQLNFYNLEGESYANSFQVELNYNVFEGFDFRTAYKFYDIKTQYHSGKLEKPLTPKHRVFANMSYETKKNESFSHWKFDVTYNWLGEQRFSSTAANPIQYQLPDYTPTVGTLNAQITRVFSEKFEVYLGGENMTNVRQDNPILGTDDPFGANFDTTFVYGPIFGSMYYAGLRFKIK